MSFDLETLDAHLAQSEARLGDIRDGCAKRIDWAQGRAKTPISVVFVHGFSASCGELWPLPDLVAKELGANLFMTRLTGHGQDGAAMGRASLPDWDADVAEAIKIGQAFGDDVIVMGCSTGCTLLTTALAEKVDGTSAIKGVVHVSPNYGLAHMWAQALLQLPKVQSWGRYIAGSEQTFDKISDDHAKYWTLKYDTQAVFTMADAVRTAMASPIEGITTAAYFAVCETDEVVSPAKTRAVMERWGGAVFEDILVQGPTDDRMGHVMAGDVFSPAQTAPLAARIIDWIKRL